MTTTTDLHYLTLAELAGRIRTRELSPVEVTDATLARIERLNPMLNAYITVMADQARADARTAADEIAGGRYRGPLHGVPIGVKDLCATRGVRTTAASKILRDWVPDEDAAVVQRLREAGAIIVGKTHLHEWAFGTTGINPHYGPARNPWNTECITGGSSSGSGVAVAAGMCYAAIGSDTGGSIRVPSSLCGVYGIKPTYGRVSVHGVIPLSWSLDHLGPMARSTRDCALVLQAIAGYDANDPTSANAPSEDWPASLPASASSPDEFLPRLSPSETMRGRAPSLEGVRVGVPAEGFEEHTNAEVKERVRAAIAELGRLGAEVRELSLPQLKDYWTPGSIVLLSEASSYHKENMAQRPEDFGEDVRTRLQWGLDQKAADYIAALRALDDVRRTADETLLPGVDVLAMPSTLIPTLPIDAAKQEDPTLGLSRLTLPFNFSGQPAMSVPCGLTQSRLPVGLQIVGRRFDERTVLRVAHTFETEAGMSLPRPPVD